MSNVLIEVDGVTVQAEENAYLLNAALSAGIYIPNLCHHPSFKPTGACGLCVVEIEGKEGVFRSCTTVVKPGMKVHVNTERTILLRRTAAELMMAEHPEECSSCPKYGKCTLQSVEQYLGTNHARFRNTAKADTLDRRNPLFLRDATRCIKCGRCVQACQELRGVMAVDYYKDENGNTYIGCGVGLMADAGCRFCGACVEVCPTGALRDMAKVQEAIAEGKYKADVLVPCRFHCPAHVDVPRYVWQIAQGDYRNACMTVLERAPFPITLGYICNHPCEAECRRREINESVSIRNLKRLAFKMVEQDPREGHQSTALDAGKRIAIVGAGPTGLTAADALSSMGHRVTVLESMPKPGGMLRYGIPAYRLPEEVIDQEIGYILSNGNINLCVNTRVNTTAELQKNYDAVLLAIGTHAGVRLPIPGANLPQVLLNTDYLRAARMGCPPALGNSVVILGGGEVAFDCAQTARRAGAQSVSIACLEAPDQMTATKETIELAKEEGILIYPSRSFLRICGSDHVEGVEVMRVTNFYFDESHRAIVETEGGSNEILVADTVIFATGQKPENASAFGPKIGRGDCFVTDETTCETSEPGIFAAGDAVTGTRSVIQAIAAGRRAAEQIDLSLGGTGKIPERWTSLSHRDDYLGPAKGFAERKREQAGFIGVAQRINGEGPIENELNCEQAGREANRCLQCDLRLKIPAAKLWVDYVTSEEGD